MNNLTKKLLSVLVTPLLALGGVVGLGTITATSASALISDPSVAPIVVQTINSSTGLVSISWNSVLNSDPESGSTYYRYSVFESATDNPLQSETIGSTSTNFQGIVGVSYYATVEPGDIDGLSNAVTVGSPFNFIVLPGVVSGISLQGGDSTLQVSWSPDVVSLGGDNESNLSYQVWLYDSNNSLYAVSDNLSAPKTTFTGLPPDDYYVVIIPANSLGQSSGTVSPPIQVGTPMVPPAMPVINSTEADGATGFISWSLINGATGYTVTVVDDSDGTVLVEAVLGDDVDSFSASGLPAGGEVLFFLTAVNEFGASHPANSFLQVGQDVAPLAPTNVVANVSGSNIDVTWDASASNDSPAVTEYVVSLYDLTAESLFLSEIVLDLEHTFVGTLTPGNDYQVRVSSVNRVAVSPTGDSSVFRAAAVAPSAVTNLNVTLTAPTTANVTWNLPFLDGGSAITEYTVDYRDGNGDGGSFSVPASVLTRTITGLSPETEYAFTVSVSNAIGTTPSDTVLKATGPGGVPIPSTVTELNEFLPWLERFVEFSSPVNGVIVTEFRGMEEGEWVYAYVHSDPIGLGWQQIGPSGRLSWDTSSLNLAPGVHRLAILDSNGVLIGVNSFTVEASAVTDGTAGGTASLPVTGSTFAGATATVYGALIAIALGLMLVVGVSVANRKKLIPVTLS